MLPIQLYHRGHRYPQHSSQDSNVQGKELEPLETLVFTIIKRKKGYIIYVVKISKPPAVILSVSLCSLSGINGCFTSRPFSL